MLTATDLLGWVIIGAAASLAGMIWPFLRGPTGALTNAVLGIVGAVTGAGVMLLVFHRGPGSPICLAGAAAGAFAALLLGHATWRGLRSLRPGHRRP